MHRVIKDNIAAYPQKCEPLLSPPPLPPSNTRPFLKQEPICCCVIFYDGIT